MRQVINVIMTEARGALMYKRQHWGRMRLMAEEAEMTEEAEEVDER